MSVLGKGSNEMTAFWKKMFVNDNTILYLLSRLIRDRFAAVASKMEHCL